MFVFECDYTDSPVCPYCGTESPDAWETDFRPGLDPNAEIQCGACALIYHTVRNVSVSYSTSPGGGK